MVGCDEIVGYVGDMRTAGIVGADIGAAPGGRDILKELQHVGGSRDAQVRGPDDTLGKADDLSEVVIRDLALPEDFAPEHADIERYRPLQVGDGIAGVMGPDDRHRSLP